MTSHTSMQYEQPDSLQRSDLLISIQRYPSNWVDHSILLQVLEVQFGITASALNWIASFLSGRTHSVRVGTKASKLYNVLFGVPQGSILGPLLFILYTSNITEIASRHGILIHLYADDTQLYVKLSTRDIEDA